MQTTSESTALDDRERARREGAVLWGKTKVLLDERDSLKAEVHRLQAQQPGPDPAKTQAKKDRAIYAGGYKSLRFEATVLDLVYDHGPQLKEWDGSRRSRAEWAKKQMKGGYVPGWRYIDAYLESLSF